MSRPDPIIIIISLLLAGFSAGAADAAGDIRVFFNQPESVTPSKSEIANPDKGIDDALIEFIDSAGSGDTLYACFYQMNHTGIASSFNEAVARGVTLYFISDDSDGDTAEYVALTTANKKLGNSSYIMHNKFCVLKDSAVWTGSYNITDYGTSRNNNNAVLIYSKELAELYENEFRHMYYVGFSTSKTLSSNSGKTVTVGNSDIDVYFAPYTDSVNTNTSLVLEDLIDDASDSILFNMFTFASSEDRIKNALIDAYERGAEVKGVVEAAHAGSRIVQSELRAEGMDVVLDANRYNLHHKFCVIDYGTQDPVVITGSYNWSDEANTKHDENFLVIHSREVTELYWKEFQKNYALAGGSAGDTQQPAVGDVLIYPSPAEDIDTVTIGYTLSGTVSEVLISVYTLTGERVIRIEPEFYPGTYNEKTWELVNSSGDGIAPGLYIIKVAATTGDGTFFDTDKFAVIR